jgi:hypothetical protein
VLATNVAQQLRHCNLSFNSAVIAGMSSTGPEKPNERLEAAPQALHPEKFY